MRDAEDNGDNQIEEWSGDDGVSGDDDAFGGQDTEDGVAVLILGIKHFL